MTRASQAVGLQQLWNWHDAAVTAVHTVVCSGSVMLRASCSPLINGHCRWRHLLSQCCRAPREAL